MRDDEEHNRHRCEVRQILRWRAERGSEWSTHGSLRWPVIEESRLPSAWAPTQQLNGKQATEATPESGADGDEDRWLTPVDIDARTARWCAAGTLALWAMFLALVKGCTQW